MVALVADQPSAPARHSAPVADVPFASPRDLQQSPPLVPAGDSTGCQCMQIERSALIDAVADGCGTAQALSMRTGAGTMCGGCLPLLYELTSEEAWQTVRCVEAIDRAARVKSFRFEIPPHHDVGPLQPAQRLVIQANIRGIGVQRSYTITSPVTERRHYEITVQREPDGLMSNWLFDNLRPGKTLAILPPSGTRPVQLSAARPLVCLVGGIGVTPALGICRSAAASGAGRRVHVDYSVSTRNQIVCAAELSELAERQQTITYRIRITREEGRFSSADIAGLVARFPHSDWLICGSKSFEADAQRLLLEHGIVLPHIHVESFRRIDAQVQAGLAATALLSPDQRKLLGYLLLVAIAAFVIQALVGIKWPLLHHLQTLTIWKALTGTALLVLLTLQWRLAYRRGRAGAAETARAYGSHIALGPAVLVAMCLHSTQLGYGLSMALSVSLLGTLATGAILGAHPRAPHREGRRRVLLASHIVLSCVVLGSAVTHGLTSLWY
jgi:ferredoxin-NADP reductase